ncbi:ABC transporter substrate-binding protein [Ornithinibacillus sp. 4-3]|uniref:ABC transporter substrate-binding protein n=1 Tax=Ornithinibacillus sp. 4-3 TaxID=3231488 RepID=A0AB39HQL2_9BACI
MKQKRLGLLFFILMLVFALVACSSNDDTTSNEGSNNDTETDDSTDTDDGEEEEATSDGEFAGGTLRIALDAQPPNLDWPTTPATSARDGARLVFETLVTTDEEYKAVPMLAENIDISEDGKTYTFKLREGVKFHNGKEMTSEDVVASMERWLEKSTITGTIFIDATWTATDDYTVVLELQEPSSLTLDTMASAKMGAAIMPKEIIDGAGDEFITDEYIGTGPYVFTEWRQDQYIHFTRYEDYQPVEEEPSGLSGKRIAHFDEIFYYVVPDSSTRLAGLQTGEYDLAYGLPYDVYDQVQNDPNIEAFLTPSSNAFLHFNKSGDIASNQSFRQAVNTALDVDEIMYAAHPNDDLFWVDCGYMDINIKNWASSAGCDENFNLKDPEKAKEYLEEAGYNGEEFKIMLTRDYANYYTAGIVIQEQLKNVGINAVVDVVDWPTFNDKMQSKLDEWDALVIGSSTVSTPPQLLYLSPTFGGGLEDEKVAEMMKALETSASIEEGQQIWDELQEYAVTEVVPVVNLGGVNSLFGLSNKLEGITAFTGLVLWNAKFTE